MTCCGPFYGTSGYYLDNIIVYAHLCDRDQRLRDSPLPAYRRAPALLDRRSACLTA